jgi:hypothetical protein
LQNEKEMFYDEYRVKNMPRKTLALITGLVLVTVVLFVIALRTNNSKPAEIATPSAVPATPVPVATAVLSLSPNPITVKPGQQGTVDVMIDSADNAVTAVQLELAYDPTIITNVKITKGALFPQPVILKDKNDNKTGRYTYMIAIQPRQATIQGSGPVATITFTAARSALGKQAQLALLPESLVTARGVANSVMKSAGGTVVTVSNTNAADDSTSTTQTHTVPSAQ